MKRKLYGLIIGLIIVVSFLEISMRIASWTFNHLSLSQINKVTPGKNTKKEIIIATLGESTTALSGNENNTLLTQDTSYPALLEKYLNQKNLPFHFRVLNRGIMMGVTSGIVEEFQRNVISEKPDIVIAMMGIKDVYDPQSKLYTGKANIIDMYTSWLSKNSSLYRFIININQQATQKSTNFKNAKNVISFNEISSSFIENNMRFMALDVGIMSELNPNYSAYKVKEISEKLFLGIYYFRTWQDDKAYKIFKNLIEENKFGYFAFSNLLTERGRILESETIYKKFNLDFPYSAYGYRELIKLYSSLEMRKELSESMKKLEKFKLHKSLPISLSLSQIYKTKGKWDLIIQTLKPYCSPDINYKFQTYPKDEIINFSQQFNKNDLMRECLNLIATAYISTGKLNLAESVLIKFSKNSQYAFSGHYLLSKVLDISGRKTEANNLLKQVLLKNKRAGEYFALADFYKKNNDYLSYDHVFKSLVVNFKDTTKNYLLLNELVSSYGGKLVIMQYPTFKIEPMIELSGNLKNVFYISNETIFDQGPRDEYFFEPNHPYNFSHYTNKGSHVLAKHVADEIEHAIKEGKI